MFSFSYLEPVCCSMSSSNCFFLTCIQVSQEAGQVVWYSHVSQNFPQFIVIHTVKGFGMVNKAEIDAFLELSCFFDDPADVGNLISGSSAFSKTSLNQWNGIHYNINLFTRGKTLLGTTWMQNKKVNTVLKSVFSSRRNIFRIVSKHITCFICKWQCKKLH